MKKYLLAAVREHLRHDAACRGAERVMKIMRPWMRLEDREATEMMRLLFDLCYEAVDGAIHHHQVICTRREICSAYVASRN
jgi:hypothetical protein